MQVPGLGYALAEVRLVGQLVPFDDGDLREVVAERTGGEDAGQAATDHGGMPGAMKRHRFPKLTGTEWLLETRQEDPDGSATPNMSSPRTGATARFQPRRVRL